MAPDLQQDSVSLLLHLDIFSCGEYVPSQFEFSIDFSINDFSARLKEIGWLQYIQGILNIKIVFIQVKRNLENIFCLRYPFLSTK